MTSGPFGSLLERWRSDAAVLRRRGAEREACVLEQAAAELAAAAEAWAAEALTLEQAALESGYSYSALEKSLRAGRLRNAGTKGAPRVRRTDLPRKAAKVEAGDFASRVLTRRAGARRA